MLSLYENNFNWIILKKIILLNIQSDEFLRDIHEISKKIGNLSGNNLMNFQFWNNYMAMNMA